MRRQRRSRKFERWCQGRVNYCPGRKRETSQWVVFHLLGNGSEYDNTVRSTNGLETVVDRAACRPNRSWSKPGSWGVIRYFWVPGTSATWAGANINSHACTSWNPSFWAAGLAAWPSLLIRPFWAWVVDEASDGCLNVVLPKARRFQRLVGMKKVSWRRTFIFCQNGPSASSVHAHVERKWYVYKSQKYGPNDTRRSIQNVISIWLTWLCLWRLCVSCWPSITSSTVYQETANHVTIQCWVLINHGSCVAARRFESPVLSIYTLSFLRDSTNGPHPVRSKLLRVQVEFFEKPV